MDLIKVAEEAFATGNQFPEFKAGDTITVGYKIVEGTKERVQLYRGVVIKICGHGDKKRFTVRKMSGTIGVERIFPMDSRTLPLSRSTSAVRCVVPNSIICASSPVRLPASRRREPSLRVDSALLPFQQRNKKGFRSRTSETFFVFYSSQARCIPADAWSPATPVNACRRVSRHRVISPSAAPRSWSVRRLRREGFPESLSSSGSPQRAPICQVSPATDVRLP